MEAKVCLAIANLTQFALNTGTPRDIPIQHISYHTAQESRQDQYGRSRHTTNQPAQYVGRDQAAHLRAKIGNADVRIERTRLWLAIQSQVPVQVADLPCHAKQEAGQKTQGNG